MQNSVFGLVSQSEVENRGFNAIAIPENDGFILEVRNGDVSVGHLSMAYKVEKRFFKSLDSCASTASKLGFANLMYDLAVK